MRIWQTRFQVIKAFQSLPVPQEIVYERQTDSSFHIEEARRESHSAAHIVCTIKGEGAFRQHDKIYPLVPGMTFAACIGTPDISYYYPGHCSTPWEFLWISFSCEQAVNIVSELNSRYGYVFRIPMDTGLIPHLERYRNQDNIFQIVSPTAGAKIVLDALAAFGETVEEGLSTSPQAKLTRDAQNLIAANIDRTLDVTQIAEKLQVTREHLTRVFRSQTGISPGKFAATERMRIAIRLLQNKSMTIKEIAERTGYDSASSFARAFKAHFHISPGQFITSGPTNIDPIIREYLNAQSTNTEFSRHIDNERPITNSLDRLSGDDLNEPYDAREKLY